MSADSVGLMDQAPKAFTKNVSLTRNENGYGFTLRHFLVFPDKSSDQLNANPLETTFVQTVKKGSSAEQFGVEEGDRILSVNGESVSGKTYNDVINLVKSSKDKVDLLLVSRREDILQMAFPASSLQNRQTTNWSGQNDNRWINGKDRATREQSSLQTHKPASKQYSNKNQNNSNRIEFAKFQQNYYDTLDSAYGTGESSYNTVDSSYSRQTDYGSADDKWRAPRRRAHQKSEASPARDPTPRNGAYLPHCEQLKFADDVNESDGSDTATETETDTEQTFLFSGCSLDAEEMSYVPDYVRPMLGSPVSVSTVTTPTNSFTTSRPIHTSTRTSPATTSAASSNLSSPTTSVKDAGFPEAIASPRGLYKRLDRGTPSYAGYREDYVRKQKEVLCGRKSLDERLRSLESGAAVKLKVCSGSQKRRKRSDTTFSGQTEKFTFNTFARSSSQSDQLKAESALPVHNTENEDLVAAPPKPPQPDIIESHQPRPSAKKSNTEELPKDLDDKIESTVAQVQHVATPTDASAVDEQIRPYIQSSDESRRLEPVCIKWNTTSTHTGRKEANKSAAESERVAEEPAVESGYNHDVSEKDTRKNDTQHHTDELAETDKVGQKDTHAVSTEHDSADTSDVDTKGITDTTEDVKSSAQQQQQQHDSTALRKLAWKKPSAETLNRLKDSNDKKLAEAKKLPEIKLSDPSSEADKSEPHEEVTIVPMRNQTRNNLLKRSVGLAPLILDVTTDNAVVPVELRSPRGEGGSFPRTNMREKRNARVFTLPSSDDSETDNLLARLDKQVEQKTVHVAPVKFVPSVLRHRSHDRKAEDVSSSTSSSVVDAYTSPAKERKETQSSRAAAPSHETSRRKSSRSPKRSKQSSSRSRSSHDRSSHHSRDRSTRSHRWDHRKTSSDSHSSTTVNHGDASSKPSHQKSPDPKKRSPHKTEKSPRSTRSRRDEEYAELSDTKRALPKSHRLRDFPSLPSPRQQAVAHAVKFGFPGDEGVIPYIDDAASPEEQKKKLPEVRHRSADSTVADPEVVRRALPLSSGSRRGRPRKRRSRSPNRRISYMEAMGSSEDLTPDPDTDGSYDIVRSSSGRDYRLNKFGRCNSADSILSTTEQTGQVVYRKEKRSTSADRDSLKGVHRRSYQIATSPGTPAPADAELLRAPQHKRQPSIRKLKNFFVESTPQIVEAHAGEGRRGSRGRLLQPVPTLDLDDYDDTVIREGFLSFKVATIEKGKRTSSQKLWKLVWVVLKEQLVYLCKDWTRVKQEVQPNGQSGAGANSTGSQTPTQLILEEEEPLNIQGSLVSIAYNYVKRKNVFKVTTYNGSEYLFQAEDRDDMLAWINSIQVSGNHDNADGEVIINEDLILRKTSQIESGPKPEKRATRKSRSPKTIRRAQVPIKDIDGSRRFKWRGSVNRIVRKFGQGQTIMQGQTFDVHLEDCPPSPNNEFIPFVVELCCRVVEERGLSFMGIYRVPGNSGTLTALQEELNFKGLEAVDLENDERFLELNVVSSLLKSFFRKLPDPLFTNELYDDLITMNRKKDPEERLNGLRRLIHMLPAPHYETLKYLVGHLRKVADNADVNKMEVRNLAIVFGPTLVRSTISDNMATMVTDMSDQCRIVESVLQHAVWFFSEQQNDGSAVDIPAPPPVDEHHEPVPNINHLLANVGRTPGDESDSTESSKSKNSLASEKESFSRDVMDMLIGVRKRWLQTQNGGANARKAEDGEEESDDEFGFKEAERRQAQSAEEQNKEENDVENSAPQSPGYQVAKAAASGIRASRAMKEAEPHFPQDIPARLYEFYAEHLERLARTEISRPPVQFSSSSETSPQVTPRHSFFAMPPPTIAGHRQTQVRRTSEVKNSDPTSAALTRQNSAPASPAYHTRGVPPAPVPLVYGNSPENRRYNKNPTTGDYQTVMATSTPLHQPADARGVAGVPLKSLAGDCGSDVSSISKNETARRDSESDSDTSVYVGDTLEEKLKNLTNLDKKLSRRPSRRHAGYPLNDADMMWDRKPGNPAENKPKRRTAPSHGAGTIITSDSMLWNAAKKSSRELYQERRAARQQYREFAKASRSTNKAALLVTDDKLSRCTSDENIFNRCDPKRQRIRMPLTDEDGPPPRPATDRVRRRHTLGGNDFPGADFWDEINPALVGHNDISVSLQNIPRSAVSRLKPRVPGPKLTGNFLHVSGRADLPTRRQMQSGKHSTQTKKTESYI